MVEAADHGLLESFCGVGNPFSLFPIQPGSAILDIGCGGGFDLYIASRKTGPTGSVVGADLTEAMVVRARENLSRAGVTNARVQKVESEFLPFANEQFDAVISNGVINLSPAKNILFAEIFRVLKPGGRFGFADIVLEKDLPPDMAASADAWAQ
ncbi:MAG: methyltransferase domain-containing protein [Nitrospiraceae bacterium]|nr:methyltransferase domain-containing protein [Nitrospiraceae bacterium]